MKLDAKRREYDIVVIGEEAHLAYNRVGLTSFFQHRKVEDLYLNPEEWVCSDYPSYKTCTDQSVVSCSTRRLAELPPQHQSHIHHTRFQDRHMFEWRHRLLRYPCHCNWIRRFTTKTYSRPRCRRCLRLQNNRRFGKTHYFLCITKRHNRSSSWWWFTWPGSSTRDDGFGSLREGQID